MPVPRHLARRRCALRHPYYLRGTKQAASAFKRFPHRAITVTTWVEVMAAEAISDRALALMEKYPELELRYAIPWATAVANELIYISCELPEKWGDKSLGTTLEIVVPVSLSAVDALIVETGGRVVGIPLDAVKRTLRVGADDLARSAQGAS